MKRSEALELGLTTYTTEKPCKHGHLAPRYSKTAICTACHAIRRNEWDEKNPERRKELNNEWRKQKKREGYLRYQLMNPKP